MDEQDRQSNWEKKIVRQLALSALQERKATRRWGIFFKLLTFAYLSTIILLLSPDLLDKASDIDKPHTAVIEIKGVIADGESASADNIIQAMREAYKDDNTKGVILRINSPGGSPVQAGYVNDEIRRLKEKHPKIPVYAVVMDMCASGGYYIAAAADKIYVDKSSIVGSIGVLMNGFGFEGAMKDFGVERRLLTAGKYKGIMDPFSPMKEEELTHVQTLLDNMHKQFIDVVKAGRGDRLSDNENLFTGLFWTGEQSIELGLADDYGSSSSVARDVIKHEKLVDFTPKEDVLGRLADRVGASAAKMFAKISGLTSSPEMR